MSAWKDYAKSPDGLAEYAADTQRYFGQRSTSGCVCIDEQPAPTVIMGEIRVVRLERGIAVQYWEAA